MVGLVIKGYSGKCNNMLTFEMESRLMDYPREDIGQGDPTTALTPQNECIAKIFANEPCTLAGIEEISFILKKSGLQVKQHKKDGQQARRHEMVIEIFGNNRKILPLERTCLNMIGRMSGVATLCSLAKKIAAKETIAVTRKTVPGFQLLDKKAAEVAGCWTHRKNLAEMVLLKDNHLHFFQSAGAAAKRAHELSGEFEIEVENEYDAREVAKYNPTIIMLDNFTPKDAKKTIRVLRKGGFGGKIELSGGIRLSNLKKYTGLGADIISMGELTKKAKIVDFSLDISEIEK